MNAKFEEMFEEKFGQTFSNESIKFASKALAYEGWLLHKEYLKKFVPEFLIEENKGE
ncbi:hypothetical protein KNT87_gp009 [Erwinia phage Cronus]|uniref:Uncharacterized protein n=1 Tax=Erwinia phage Cronus TaxID=2163633 RepID=A0A2S1GM30_9CAUD|nr:hypothetical protein KNT87_gp009 [Erwinia phage Cronus]AWD90448.1 hypothetical protein [Erwinia phage Cronus]